AAAREVHGRRIVVAVVGLELLAVATDTVQPLDPTQDAVARLMAAAADLDVIAAREIELGVVEPPRHVEMHTADAVLVVRDAVGQLRNETADAQTRRVGEVLAD